MILLDRPAGAGKVARRKPPALCRVEPRTSAARVCPLGVFGWEPAEALRPSSRWSRLHRKREASRPAGPTRVSVVPPGVPGDARGTQIAPPASCCAGGAMDLAPVWIGACAYVAPRIPLLPRSLLSDRIPLPMPAPDFAGRTSPHVPRAHVTRLARGSLPAARGWRWVWVRRYGTVQVLPSRRRRDTGETKKSRSDVSPRRCAARPSGRTIIGTRLPGRGV